MIAGVGHCWVGRSDIKPIKPRWFQNGIDVFVALCVFDAIFGQYMSWNVTVVELSVVLKYSCAWKTFWMKRGQFWHYLFTHLSFQTSTFFCRMPDIVKKIFYNNNTFLSIMNINGVQCCLYSSVQIWIDKWWEDDRIVIFLDELYPFNLLLQLNLKSNLSCNDAKESSFLVPTAAHHSP